MLNYAFLLFRRRPAHDQRWVLGLLACISITSLAQASSDTSNAQALLDMSLEELLSVKIAVPAALTKLTRLESPTAITVITAEDIHLTPARNLYDLIDVYVPGAFWMTSESGPHLGVRGNISSRNYKYLLLVNGRIMNNKAFAGASSEMEMWDLSDIERIEIVSGPGSVTYGPGAVAGVISITTRKPNATHQTSVSTSYLSPYQSKALTFSHQHKTDTYKMFAHLSVVGTEGEAAHTFQVSNNNQAGYVGENFHPNGRPLDYYGDYQDHPQIKAHIELDFANDWKWWTRYTQQGSNWFSNEEKSSFGGQLINQQGLRSRQFTTAVEHKQSLSDTLNIASMVSFDSYDFERRRDSAFSPDPGNALNYQVNFAENELLLHSTLNWQVADWAQFALGGEWSRNHYGAGWGDSPQAMRLGESGEIINGPDSDSLTANNGGNANRLASQGWPAIYVGDGWYDTTQSIFTEANLAFTPTLKFLISGRLDKNSYTNWLLSPRAAWISTLAEGHVLKFTAQRSARMNTASQLFANAQHGITNKPEQLDSLELRYSAQISKDLSFDLSAFHNSEEVIAFQGIDNTNRLMGKLKLNGLEGNINFKLDRARIGASFSWVKQEDWQLEPGVLSSGVSYSDYNLPVGGSSGGVQHGFGNDLNNWPNQSLKLFGNYTIGNHWTLHVDARWYSKMQGAQDGLDGLRQAVAGTSRATPAFYAALDQIEAENAYGSQIRFNALLEYDFSTNSTFQLYGQNLFTHSNKRYAYDDAGSTSAAPRRVRFVEEPTTFGIRLIQSF